jgi:diguanylate cyclase (GGDEF)-like protein
VQWDGALLDASVPILIGDLRLGGVRVGMSTERMEAAVGADTAAALDVLRANLETPASVLLLGLLALLGGIALIGWWVARGLVQPIRALSLRAEEIEQGHYGAAAQSTRQDELGDLMRAFGRMSEGVRKHHADIRKLAYQDPLTALANRLSFRERLEYAIASNGERGLALLFIDLDDFKRINDTLGHDAGDQVLIEFADRFHRALPPDGVIPVLLLARLGGDEFVALIEGPQAPARAESAAQALLDELKRPFEVGGKSLLVGASIGITVYPDDAQSPKLLLKHGDLAMYQAKQQGKSCYRFFAGHLTLLAEERLTLEHELREALEREQLEIAYQPIYSLASGDIVGAEALLRWHHAQRGAIPPSLFVPVAEATGLIDRLGDYVLQRACRDAAAWQREAPGRCVAVNVSGRQIQRDGLETRVAAALSDSGLEPALLHLELTESSLMHDEAQAFAVLGKLRQSGARVWLDDFGTGFSGLSHLRRARVDGVKIDRSFIADILNDPEDLALASAIVAMATSLGMEVIGEGVESAAQFKLLRSLGCQMAQGFWMSRAVSASELALKTAVALPA